MSFISQGGKGDGDLCFSLNTQIYNCVMYIHFIHIYNCIDAESGTHYFNLCNLIIRNLNHNF